MQSFKLHFNLLTPQATYPPTESHNVCPWTPPGTFQYVCKVYSAKRYSRNENQILLWAQSTEFMKCCTI